MIYPYPYWKIVIILAWPVIFAIKHAHDAVKERWMLEAYRRQWFWKRFFDALVSILSYLVIMESASTDKDQHWLLFESFLITSAIDMACHTSYDIFYLQIRLLADICYHLFIAAFAWYVDCRPLAYLILTFVAFWLAIPILEEDVVDEVVAPLETRYWNMVSALESSNNDFGTLTQFRPIKVIDFNMLDDPFWPHISTIYVIETCRHHMLWHELMIWQVSLLNGDKKKIHTFNYFASNEEPPSIDGSQSNGVLMICISYHRQPPLFLYDVRFGMPRHYILPMPIGHVSIYKIASISCQRLFNQDESVNGWRIRIVWVVYDRCDCHEEEELYRSIFCTTVYELRKEARVINHEEIVFGQCLEFTGWIDRCVRTSRGHVGVYREDQNLLDGPVMLFDPFVDQFAILPNFDTLLQIDRPLALYIYTPSPVGSVQLGDQNGNISPPVLTDRECVEFVKGDVIFSTRFKTPSIRLFAAMSAFKSMPNLRREMSAEEFRAATGISEMQGQFDP